MSRNSRKQIQNNKGRSLITHHNPKSIISELYRTIRTNIQFSLIDDEMKTLMVTSAGPGEGKSTTISNLAVVMAQQGNHVLLVDADLRKPTVHHTFRQTNTRGLTNVLTRQLSLEEAIKDTEVERLSILPSGPVPPNPSELLGSKMMEQLIEDLSLQYDIVLFDCPPILAVTDAQVMANYCQGVVLVVKSGTTEIEAALKAQENLEHVNAKLLGVVLNDKPMNGDTYYYYYYG
ncbi:CpsD/CapB family tyrosine-protein kinase [Pueribacillus sp. YX66]|uniref:CpsD/CapB family tyrosine-protein kinase n=1 Tax=Pueribacillus sp. YX66 TaxID=3229242 RepID=UPI00358D08A4